MKALLLVAHGSRRESSNEEVRAMAGRLAEKAGREFPVVECAFLELAEPSIPEGIDRCVRAGAGEVVILPYFLSAGRHVSSDIPGQLRDRRERYPDVVIRLAPHLGSAESLSVLLLQLALRASGE